MGGFFSRWFGSSDNPKQVFPAVRRSHLTLEELEPRDVPATLYVTSLADVPGGPGELRTEVSASHSGDTVEFRSYLSGGTVNLTGGQINITGSITIESTPGAGPVTINAQKNSAIFDVTTGATTFYITGLTLENGNSTANGGGINTSFNNDNLFVTDSTITGCRTGAAGGAIYAENSLTMVDSTISNNYASGFGGGIRMNGAGTIQTSTITGNQSGTSNGGAIWCSGYLGIFQSDISNNTAAGSGGAIRCTGSAASLTIVNCTFYENTATGGNGGAISINGYGTDALTNNTIVSNSSATSGGGVNLSLYGTTNNYTLYGYFTNDIVALNTSLTDADIYGTIEANNCDINNNTGINYLGGSGGNIGANPDLGPLQFNGGLSDTMMPKPDSPVINAGTNVGAPNVDQRGISRPQGGFWDIGAVEVRGYTLSIVSGNFQSVPENQLFAPLVVQIISDDLGVLPNNNITWTVNLAPNGATGIPQTPLVVATNAQGEASLLLLADGETGTFTVDASTKIPFDFPGKQTLFFTLQIIDSAHTLEFAQQPLAVVAGQAQTVTILALNSQDKVALDATGAKFPLILELIDSAGNVVQNLGTVNLVDGVATFNDIVLNTVGVGYQFKAIATELDTVGDVSYIDSISFDVNPNQPTIGRRRT